MAANHSAAFTGLAGHGHAYIVFATLLPVVQKA